MGRVKRVAVLFFLFGFLFLIFVAGVRAQGGDLWEEVEGSASARTSADETAIVDYVLPYPGILPDSPLWVIKALRDKVVGLFMFDPVQKGYYNLHLADKYLAAGIALKNYGKTELGEKTLVLAEEHLGRALTENAKARSRNIDTATLEAKLSRAAVKHREATAKAEEIYNRVRKLFEQKLPSL